MATGGWWFSPSRLRDLLAIILPMIEAPNRGPPSTLPPDREQVRTDQTTGDGHIGAKLDHSRRRADCLATYASSEQRAFEREVRETWKNRSERPCVCMFGTPRKRSSLPKQIGHIPLLRSVIEVTSESPSP